MGSRHSAMMSKKPGPILNEHDYRAAKALVEREMKQVRSGKAWEGLEALIQEVAEYEARFLVGEEEDGSGLAEDDYATTLDDDEAPRRHWTGADDI